MIVAESAGEAASRLLRPKSIAIVGASDRSRWSVLAFENLTRHSHKIDLKLVNRRGGEVHGRQAAVTCAALGEAVDLGVVLVPKDGVVAALAWLGYRRLDPAAGAAVSGHEPGRLAPR